jgi:serine/threonine-protein kinase
MRASIPLALYVLATLVQAQTPPPRDVPRFPAGAVWYQDISALTPDPNSATMTAASIGWGTGTTAFQIDFSMHRVYASWGGVTQQPLVQEQGYYLPDCDTGYGVPVPSIGAIEGSTDYTCDYANNDCHLFIVAGDTLYESFATSIDTSGLNSLCLVKWHLNLVYPPDGRGDGCTSADAAGFPMAPLIFSPDEVYAAMQVTNGDLGHAIRFVLPNPRMRANSFVHPASHYGGPSGPANAIPYGARLRLRANFDISGYNAAAQVILRTLKKYGMFLSDGGSVPLTADDGLFTVHQWTDPDIAIDSHSLFGVALGDFDVMPLGTVYTVSDCTRNGFGDDVIFADGYNW